MVRKYMIAGFVVICLICAYVSRDLPSLENTDYVVSMKLCIEENSDGAARVELYVANLLDYKGSSEQTLKTEEYGYQVRSVAELMPLYKEEVKRELSLSHIKQLILESASKQDMKDMEVILFELSEYVNLSDDIRVKLPDDMYQNIARDEDNTIGFRTLIKNLYKGEG